MACLGVDPGAVGWKAQTNPLSYGGTQELVMFTIDIEPLVLVLSRLPCTHITYETVTLGWQCWHQGYSW